MGDERARDDRADRLGECWKSVTWVELDFVGWLVLVEQVALYGSACGQLGLALATPAVNELAERGRIMLAVDVWDYDLDGHFVEVGEAPIAATGGSAAPMSRPSA